MTGKTPATNLEMDLQRLEQWLDDLIGTCERLNEENYVLRKENDLLSTERDELREKGDQARSRVETIVTRLKAMENSV
ncbi:TIGR02449 family protein [Solemya pervernicosa gill symbiont]|uniref:TIGR02449 family protein n=2 Tax=Gammaproteobacteria incertae sedis TaxID=118884 RepID=A0A1T2L320_9GAMM|nr:TIGR02449 family protein [Candidatus Reidiella endopervernicosa]OOZ39493.1 TIGR02449 family protein [Solemya pervernicosa gill symbiont]